MIKLSNLKKWVFSLVFILATLGSASAQQSNETFYFEGTLGPHSIHMTLTFFKNNTVKGFYTYDSQVAQGNNNTIPLEGTYSGDIDEAHLMLIEYNPSKSKAIGTFDCRIEGGYGWDPNASSHYLTISGGTGYRNYKSGKTFKVDLFASKFYPKY